MWYRKILAYREIIDPKGEKSIHKHSIEGGYHSPIFVMKPGDEDISKMLGTGSKAFGPGHYTSQNKVVAYGYQYPFTREEKFPMGTRILDYDKIDEVHGKRIVDAINQKFNKDIVVDFPTDMYSLQSKLDLELNQLYPILVELGYDAIEYDAGRNFSLDQVVEQLKENPKLLNPERKNLDKESTDFEKPKSFNRRIKKLKQQFDKKNVLVINANILTNPRLFQKERFRPETLTEEEKETLEKGKYVSSLDVTIKVIEYMKKTDPDWENKLRSFSCEAILNLLVAGVIDKSFPFGTIYKNKLNGQKALEFLSKGIDPTLVIAYTKDITFDDYENIKDFLEQNGKEYLVPKLERIVSYNDADTIVKLLQNNIVDLPTATSKFFEANKSAAEKLTISDIEKLISVGFTPNDFSRLALQPLPEDAQRLVKVGFDKKNLLNWFATRGNLDFSKTGFTVEDIIENYDIKSLNMYINLMINLNKRDINIKPLWENFKTNFLARYDHLSYVEREGYTLNIIEALKNTDVSLKEIIDNLLKPSEHPVFVKTNMPDSVNLRTPLNSEIIQSIERYDFVRDTLNELESDLFDENTLVCKSCNYIFKSSQCPICKRYAKKAYLDNYWFENLNYFDKIVDIYTKMPISRDWLNDLIYLIDNALAYIVEIVLPKEYKPLKHINYYFRKFIEDPRYLETFSSLEKLKEKVDKNEFVDTSMSDVNNVNDEDDGTITLSDPDED